MILDSTLGVWLAANYTYKGREIAKYAREALRTRASDMGCPIGDSKRGSHYAQLDQELASIEMRYHKAEMERLEYGRTE